MGNSVSCAVEGWRSHGWSQHEPDGDIIMMNGEEGRITSESLHITSTEDIEQAGAKFARGHSNQSLGT
jgi:hypothetical protein